MMTELPATKKIVQQKSIIEIKKATYIMGKIIAIISVEERIIKNI